MSNGIRIEILGVDDQVARFRVSDMEGRSVVSTCGAGVEAHRLLRLIVHNATRELAAQRINEQMDGLAKRARIYEAEQGNE